MVIKGRTTTAVVVLVALAILAGLYDVLVHPYFVMPRLDEAFLRSVPTQDQVIARFGQPDETVAKGETFRQTGWYPCPGTPATDTAQSFVRRYGDKIYIFYDHKGNLRAYARGRS
jgi:hypothetical protein